MYFRILMVVLLGFAISDIARSDEEDKNKQTIFLTNNVVDIPITNDLMMVFTEAITNAGGAKTMLSKWYYQSRLLDLTDQILPKEYVTNSEAEFFYFAPTTEDPVSASIPTRNGRIVKYFKGDTVQCIAIVFTEAAVDTDISIDLKHEEIKIDNGEKISKFILTGISTAFGLAAAEPESIEETGTTPVITNQAKIGTATFKAKFDREKTPRDFVVVQRSKEYDDAKKAVVDLKELVKKAREDFAKNPSESKQKDLDIKRSALKETLEEFSDIKEEATVRAQYDSIPLGKPEHIGFSLAYSLKDEKDFDYSIEDGKLSANKDNKSPAFITINYYPLGFSSEADKESAFNLSLDPYIMGGFRADVSKFEPIIGLGLRTKVFGMYVSGWWGTVYASEESLNEGVQEGDDATTKDFDEDRSGHTLYGIAVEWPL